MTTPQELTDYYAGLLILQYAGKPKAAATIRAIVEPVIMPQTDTTALPLPLAVQDGFNVAGSDIAVGVQLDTVGKYQGVARTGVGFSGSVTLTDAEYLTLIQMASIVNNAGSSLATIQDLLFQFFPSVMRVFDHANMQISYLISSVNASPGLVQLFVAEGLLPRPIGVSLAVIYAPSITTFFGFRTYDLAGYAITPFNTYDSYLTARPWLSYANSAI